MTAWSVYKYCSQGRSLVEIHALPCATVEIGNPAHDPVGKVEAALTFRGTGQSVRPDENVSRREGLGKVAPEWVGRVNEAIKMICTVLLVRRRKRGLADR